MYRSLNIVRVIRSRKLRWAGHVARMEEGRSVFKILTGKRPQGRSRCSCEGNVKVDLTAMIVNPGNWIGDCSIEPPGFTSLEVRSVNKHWRCLERLEEGSHSPGCCNAAAWFLWYLRTRCKLKTSLCAAGLRKLCKPPRLYFSFSLSGA